MGFLDVRYAEYWIGNITLLIFQVGYSSPAQSGIMEELGLTVAEVSLILLALFYSGNDIAKEFVSIWTTFLEKQLILQ